MNDEPSFWFPMKQHGWGWGLPVRWQGWVVFAAYAGLLYAGLQYFKSQRGLLGLTVFLAVLTAALIAIVVAKGERPPGWRWGKRPLSL